MNEDGTPIQTPQVDTPPEAPIIDNPNELEFEMTPEQEQDYVNQILANGNYEAPVDDKHADDTPPQPETPKTPETPPTPEKLAEQPPEKVETPEAPTEISAPQTNDLWIEVEQTVVDDLGEETTKMVKLVYDPNDPASFIPDDFQAKNTKQLAEIMDAKAEMAGIYKERQGEFEKVQATEAAAQQEKDLIASWDNEIADLIKSGVIEAPKLKPGDSGFDEDPANVKTNAVFEFMAKTNEERAKEGIAPIQSFALAFTMYENDAAEKAKAEAQEAENAEIKKKGALVGGGSATSGGTVEQRAYKAGSYNNIWQVPVED